jgi:hypothetical protein
MGDFIFPLQFKRQFSGPLDLDLVFSTTLQRNNFLTQERRYAGQIVTDLQDGKIYQLNAARDKWIDISLQGVSKFLSLTGGKIYGDVTIHGDLSSSGTQYFANTIFNTTSALSVVNFGSSAALYVSQDGTGDIASFYDKDSGIEVLHVGGDHSLNNFVGVRTSTPNKEFTVNGEISASAIYDGKGGSSDTWNSVFSNVNQASAYWTFQNDLIVSLPIGKSFGRYSNGSVIPATGKTPKEVILLSIQEPITPAAFITPSSSTTTFNKTAIYNTLNFTHFISSLNATCASGTIDWRRNNTGAWTNLSATTLSAGSYIHSLTDTNYNTQPFNYRYVVTDTAGAAVTATNNVTVVAYSAPTITISVTGPNISGSESNLAREKGNVSSNISGTITRISTYVPLVSYAIEYQVNGSGSWFETGISGQFTGDIASLGIAVNDQVTFSDLPVGSGFIGNTYRIATTPTGTTFNISDVNGNALATNNAWITPNVSKVVNPSTGVSYTLVSLVNGLFTAQITNSHTITATNHNNATLSGSNSIGYRIKVVDQFRRSDATQDYSSTSLINFYNLIFLGPSSSAPTTSSQVRALSSILSINTSTQNPFDLHTGTTHTNFTVAMPNSLSITNVIDLDASNAPLTNNYINNPFNVNDYAGTATSYKVYTLTAGIPYSSNHRHQVTRA